MTVLTEADRSRLMSVAPFPATRGEWRRILEVTEEIVAAHVREAEVRLTRGTATEPIRLADEPWTRELEVLEHVHVNGRCRKNRFGRPCHWGVE